MRKTIQLADRIRKDKRVQELETDPDIFVTLKPGFRFSTDPVHCFGEETLSDVLRSLTLVQECNCNQCEKERDNGKETFEPEPSKEFEKVSKR